MRPEQPARPVADEPRRERFASLGAALAIITLHVSSYLPVAAFGMAFHRDQAVSRVTEILGAIWMTVPLACIRGVALGFRSVRRNGWSALDAIGILLNCLYSLVGVFLWLIVALNVRV